LVNLVYEPSVYLASVSRAESGISEFLRDQGVVGWESDAEADGDYLPEVAGRLCYLSFSKPRPGGNKAYVDHIKEMAHGSVLEHTNVGLILTGVSRSLTHELVRHRAGMAYSQLSQRYVDEADTSFVVPPKLIDDVRRETDIGRRWLQTVDNALHEYCCIVYRMLLPLPPASSQEEKTAARKAAREAARSVLPNATETHIMVTGNARAWRHFLEMRASLGADAEIRRLALAVYRKLLEVAPNLFGDYRVETTNGVEHLVTPWSKV